MIDDLTLLRRYAQNGDDDAFREVVEHYLPLVYSAALRQLGEERHLAEDVAQGVFWELARQAATLSPRVVLAGWLFRTTRYVASNVVRSEQRRRRRETAAVQEQKVHPMNTIADVDPPEWSALQGGLDEAVSELNDKDRNAILLRFFQGMDFHAVGAALGISDDTAQKRVSRALEKLRGVLARRMIAPSAGALGLWLATHAVASPPPGLAETVAAHAVSGGAAATPGGFALALRALLRSKLTWITGALSLSLGFLVLATLSTRTVPPPPGLAAWWRAEGNARDRISGREGILLPDTGFGRGRSGLAFQFGSHSAGVRVPGGGSLNLGTAPGMTMEFWMQPTVSAQPPPPGFISDNSTTPLVEWSNGPEWGLLNNGQWWGAHVHVQSGDRLLVNITDTGAAWHRALARVGPLEPGVWHHVAVTFDKASGAVRLFFDGRVVADRFEAGENVAGFTPDTRGDLFIGRRPGGEIASSFFGKIDEVSLYARALHSDEIATLAAAPAKRDGPVAPVILTEPNDQGEASGGTATLNVGAAGTGPLDYQWCHNGEPLAFARRAVLDFTGLGPAQTGEYFAVIRNAAGAVTSRVARVTTEPAPLPAGLVAWWRAERDARDDRSGEVGAAEEGLAFGQGRVGQAFFFDGRGDGVRMPGRPTLDLGPGPGFTVEAWIKPERVLGKFPVAGWNEPAAGPSAGVNLALANGRIYARLRDRRGQSLLVASPDAPVSPHRWQHVALVFDGATGEARLHCNGTAVAQESAGPFAPDTAGDFFLGCRPGARATPGGETAPLRFAGWIDEVSLYDRPLRIAELEAIAAAGGAGKRGARIAGHSGASPNPDALDP